MNKSVSTEQTMTADLVDIIYDEDAKYVAIARSGDMEAFEVLVKKYEGKVFSVALHMLQNRDDAGDAAQEVFLRVFRSLTDFRGGSKFSTWLFRITNNVCLDFLRKRSRNDLSLDADAGKDDESAVREIPSDCDVEALAESSEFNGLVRKAINDLPVQHRAMIVMRDMQGLSYTEIAKLLGLPEGTVKSRISRARGNLRNIFLSFKELKDYINVKYISK